MEKRSTSEKILPKASLKRFSGLPFMIPIPGDGRLGATSREQGNTNHPINKLDNVFQGARMTVKGGAEFLGPEMHNQNKFVLKKTTSVFQLQSNNITKGDMVVAKHPLVHFADREKGSPIEGSPRNSKMRERLTHVDRVKANMIAMDYQIGQIDKENQHTNLPRFSTVHKNAMGQNGLRASFKINPKEKLKTKHNIVSFDPIMRTEMIRRESTQNQMTAAKLPDSIPKENYMELLVENMILKEKCRDNENIKKILFENLLTNRVTESAQKQTPAPQAPLFFESNKEPMSDPWFLLTQGAKQNVNGVQQERVFQTPDPKSNCCVNYINNNYHMNFVSPIKKEGRKTDSHKPVKGTNETAWRDRLTEYLQNNQNHQAFKKRPQEEHIYQEAQGTMTKGQKMNESHQTSSFNNQLVTEKQYKIKATHAKLKSPKGLKPTKLKIPINFLEDSSSNKDNIDSTEVEGDDQISMTPQVKQFGANGKCDTLNFTFSNFKDQNK